MENVQKINLNKEAELNSAKINTLETDSKKIRFRGYNLNNLASNPRYKTIFLLFSLVEDDLEESIPYDINLTCLTLEAFVKAINELGEYKESFNLFRYLEPLNFFRLVNDLSIQTSFCSSDEIASKYLTSEKMLKKLNRFYNEYNDIYEYCVEKKYTSLYLFDMTSNNVLSGLVVFPNLTASIHSDDKNKRHIASSLLNELQNEVKRCNISESSKDEYYYKLRKIDLNYDTLLEKINLSELCSIDSLYYML